MKAFLLSLLLPYVCLAQFGGPQLPFFGAPSSGPCSTDLRTLPGLILYTDIYQGLTNLSGTAAGNGQAVAGWMDLSGNGNPLIQLGGGALCPTNFITGGPTNGPMLSFVGCGNKVSLTNYIGGGYVPQPNTYFVVMRYPGTGNGDCQAVWLDGTSTSASKSQEIITFHPDIGLTGMNLVAPASVFLWDGRAGDGSSNFGWPYDSWAIVTVQFNNTNSHVFVNGIGPLHTLRYGPDYAPGTNGMAGFTIGNGPTGINGSGNSATTFKVAAIVWVTGSVYTNSATRLAVEEQLGCEFGISVP